MICIKNGTIHNAVQRNAFSADILIQDGKIKKIGKNLADEFPDAEVINAEGLCVYPGFVEAHCHTGLCVSGASTEGYDVNETSYPVTPQLCAADAIDPFDLNLELAAKAGVTCIATGPGSANVIGGTFSVIKTWGKRVDSMLVKERCAMKCAFGENPKGFYRAKGVSTRMMNASILRTELKKASIYNKKIEMADGDISKYPPYDEKCEALLPVIRKEIPLKAHAHQANDIFTAIRIAKECDVKLTLEHVTDGHLVAEELKNEKYPMAVGPTMCSASKRECRNINWETPGILAKAGCHVSIITDAPVVPLENLPLYAGMAVKAGMDEFDALKAITIHAAEHIGVSERVGSIEEGKDADLVITDGSPFKIETEIKAVFINGSSILNLI